MIIGINEKHQIKQLHNITDPLLTAIEIDEETNPFKGWTDIKIMCYCYEKNDNSTAIYPYVDYNKILELEQESLSMQAQIVDLQIEVLLGGI